MTNAEYRKSVMSDCGMSAQDCKGSADYAAYAFKQGNEPEARRYFQNLTENLATLKSNLASLDYVNAKIAANGPDAEG